MHRPCRFWLNVVRHRLKCGWTRHCARRVRASDVLALHKRIDAPLMRLEASYTVSRLAWAGSAEAQLFLADKLIDDFWGQSLLTESDDGECKRRGGCRHPESIAGTEGVHHPSRYESADCHADADPCSHP